MPANQLHPIYHVHACQAGSRIDVDRILPLNLDDVDTGEWLEKLSEPPNFKERIAPVSTIIGSDVIRGKNWSEMMIKSYRVFLRLFQHMALYLRQAMIEKFEERGMLPYSGLSIDPDTLHQIIEMDYEQGENAYGTLLELYRTGVLCPTATVPFHAVMPLMDNDFDRRMTLRVGLLMFWDDVRMYHDYLTSLQPDAQFIFPFWFPECGFSMRLLEMLHEEFQVLARRDRLKDAHLLILLDTAQVQPTDIDVLMKSWNVVKVGADYVSVVFRDRGFSDWVTYSNPSVKKLIDRTIAKVDSGLNEKGVNYCWGHFEELESLTINSKAVMSYDQKVTKLAQLSYEPLSPDMFVRRKMDGGFGRAPHEPQEVLLKDDTAWTDWHTNPNLGRWQGVLDSTAFFKLVDENRTYTRRTRAGKLQELGPQAWKSAFFLMRQKVSNALKGDPNTMTGGLLEILMGLTGMKDPKLAKRNVTEFLVFWSHSHFREIFLQRDLSEADVEAAALIETHLLMDSKKRLTEEEQIQAAVAAQAYYFVLSAHRSQATAYENMDSRVVYQSTVLLTLGACNLISLYHWRDELPKAKEVLDLVKSELLDFGSAFDRYVLADYGITRQEWDEALKPQVDDSTLNVVERAARRVAAKHLRPLGYKKDFSKEDEFLTTNVGHVWSVEIENTNYKWENKLFCGLREE